MPTTSAALSWATATTTGEVEALAAAATAADGTAPLSEQALRHVHHPEHGGVAHLLARDGGRLVGYAQLDAAAATPDGTPDPVAELVVHPDRRRRGVGTALLAALEERPGPLRVWAHGDHPGAAALARRFGLTVERALWRMRRSLREPFADPVLPDGVALRPLRVGVDEPELLRVNNAAFAWHPEQGGWTLDDVAEREAEPWFDAEGVLLAVDVAELAAAGPAHVLGFHWTKVHPADPASTDPRGEVYVLAVDPAARGRRLGPALTLAGLAHLRDRGVDAVQLYVEADNATAVRLYRGLGFTRWSADVSYRRSSAGERSVTAVRRS